MTGSKVRNLELIVNLAKKSPLFLEREWTLFFLEFFYLTILLKLFPAVKPGVFLAGILIGAPV